MSADDVVPSDAQVQAAAEGRATQPGEPHAVGSAGRLHWLLAGLAAGAVSMALGEYVSVSSQRDSVAVRTPSAAASGSGNVGTGGVAAAGTPAMLISRTRCIVFIPGVAMKSTRGRRR